MDILANIPAKDGPMGPPGEAANSRAARPSRGRLALALVVAAASDALSFWIDLLLPVQWALDIATALLLFLILGRRWAILPGLVSEAIPGLGIFPAWILVVCSIILYDDIKGWRRAR